MENLEILVLIVDVKKKILDNVVNINVDLRYSLRNQTKAINKYIYQQYKY
jgi:hypothetical protein